MDKDKKRKAASVHQKLLNKARETNRPFNELLQYYAMERFLYRMSRSEYVDQLVLKGALLLRITGISEIRSTRDIDFLGMNDAGIEQEELTSDFQTVIEEVEEFLWPPTESIIRGEKFT